MTDTGTLSAPEIDLVILAGRRGDARDHGAERARHASSRATGALVAMAGAVWALNAVCVGVQIH